MNNLLQRIFDVSPYLSNLERARAQAVYTITTLLLVLYGIYATLIPTWSTPEGDVVTTLALILRNPLHVAAVSVYIYVVVAIATIWLTRTGKLDQAAWLPLVMWGIGGVALAALTNGQFFSFAFTLMLLISLATLLQRQQGLFVSFILSLVALPLVFIFGPHAPYQESTSDLMNIGSMMLGNVIVMYLLLRFNVLNRSEGAARAVAERLKLAELNTQITRQAAQRVPMAKLLEASLNLILENYPEIYHAQVFLLDEPQQNAELVASTGSAGRQLIARRHALGVGSASVIGQVTGNNQPVIARAGVSGSIHRRNEFLPDTRLEAAFPLRAGDTIIGALDLQSKTLLTLQPDEVATFQSIADSLALAVDNVQQAEQSEARIQENQRLAEQTQNALRQVERLNERLIGRAWSDYLQTQDEQSAGLNIDFASNQITREQAWTPTLGKATRHKDLIIQQGGEQKIIAIPLKVRGQVIGAMEFELDAGADLSEADMELVREIGDRFGLAAENTRLLQESQRNAQREALINAISSRLQSSNNVSSILTEAARNLQETLKVDRVAIRLGQPEQNGIKNGTPSDKEQW